MKIDEIREGLSSKRTFKAKMAFCKENFEYMSGGTGRKVFDIGNGQALKLGCNRKGIEQNLVESDYELGQMYPDLLNPPIESCDDGHWIIVPLLEKVSKKDLERHVGMTQDNLEMFLDGMEKERKSVDSRLDFESLEENEVMSQIQDLVFNTELLTGDWCRTSSWGFDPQTQSLKIIDWGMDKRVFDRHYSFNRNSVLAI